MNDSELWPNLIKFLQGFPWAQGKIVLTTLTLGDKDGKNKQPCTQVFDVAEAQKAADWAHGACFNLTEPKNVYFTANGLRSYNNVPKKLTEAHIHAVEWLIVDMDARPGENLEEERTRLIAFAQDEARLKEKGLPGLPTFSIMTGNGVQLCYHLREPFVTDGDKAKIADIKLYGKGIENALVELGADDCHSIEHLFRLPFTRNNPDAKKAKRGRIPIIAELLGEPGWDRVYDLGQFESFKSKTVPEVKSYEPQIDTANVARIAELPETIEPLGRVVIAQGKDPDQPNRFASRSEALHYACCAMVRAKLDDTQMYSIITDRGWLISASVLDKGRGMDGYARRQIERARTKVEQTLDKDKNGRPYPTIKNVRLALIQLGAELQYDEFTDHGIIEGLPGFGPVLQDAALDRLWLRCEGELGLAVGKDKFRTIVKDTARHNVYNPVTEYLDSLHWDGQQRTALWLVNYLGAKDTPYTRAVGSLFLRAAVRRARHPGCKFDEMLVLESPQGTGKSSALRILAVRDEWFSDTLDLNGKAQEHVEQTKGKWIIEAGELKGMRAAKIEALKCYLARQVDGPVRMAFGYIPEEWPRHFVVFGTTNTTNYLKDSTGNRRFWPVRVARIDLKALRADRDQLWAEAAQEEAAGLPIRLDPSLYAEAAKEQGKRFERHAWCDLLENYLQQEQGRVARDTLWEFLAEKGIRPTRQTDGNELSEAMQQLGFKRVAKMRFKSRPGPVPGFWRGNKNREIVGYGLPDKWECTSSQGGTDQGCTSSEPKTLSPDGEGS